MHRTDIFRAWGRILQGRHPSLSIEITTRCPLSCPGCYAYQPEHLDGVPLTSLADLTGQSLVEGVLDLVDRENPLVVHLVGGEPLVRYREIGELLPQLDRRGIRVELVTSAVRRIPPEWAAIPGLSIVVSIDGLQPEHDARRKPATYERILKHIEGHRITVHCTITSQMIERNGYLTEFVRVWSERPEVASIRVSFFTPQMGETSAEILSPEQRRRGVAELDGIRGRFPKLLLNQGMVDAYLSPPLSPRECVFARVTRCVSADLETVVTPCQFGGDPDCANCGCVASIGLHAIGRHELPGGIPVGRIFDASLRVGDAVRRVRTAVAS